MRSLRLMGEEVIPAREMGKDWSSSAPLKLILRLASLSPQQPGLLSQPRTALRPDSCLLVPSPSGRGFYHGVRGFSWA